MIRRLPSVTVLVWITLAFSPVLAIFVAVSVWAVFVLVMVAAIVIKDGQVATDQFEAQRRAALRDAAQRAEIAERRRQTPDWSWPR